MFISILFFKPNRSGSLVVDYRVSWNETDTEKLTKESMQRSLSEYLTANSNYLSIYLVDTTSVAVNRVMDICATNSTSMG